jgi:hypothetical protein
MNYVAGYIQSICMVIGAIMVIIDLREFRFLFRVAA